MPVNINGETFYRTTEACQMAGISRPTLFRWLKNGIFQDVIHKDRRGWRLFTNEDIERLKGEANKVEVHSVQQSLFQDEVP